MHMGDHLTQRLNGTLTFPIVRQYKIVCDYNKNLTYLYDFTLTAIEAFYFEACTRESTR